MALMTCLAPTPEVVEVKVEYRAEAKVEYVEYMEYYLIYSGIYILIIQI